MSMCGYFCLCLFCFSFSFCDFFLLTFLFWHHSPGALSSFVKFSPISWRTCQCAEVISAFISTASQPHLFACGMPPLPWIRRIPCEVDIYSVCARTCHIGTSSATCFLSSHLLLVFYLCIHFFYFHYVSYTFFLFENVNKLMRKWRCWQINTTQRRAAPSLQGHSHKPLCGYWLLRMCSMLIMGN